MKNFHNSYQKICKGFLLIAFAMLNLNSIAQLTGLGKISGVACTDTKVYVCTQNGGVFVSSDHGKTWEGLNEELPTFSKTSLESIAVDGDVIAVFESAKPNNVYYSTDAGKNWRKMAKYDNEGHVSAISVAGGNIVYDDYYEYRTGDNDHLRWTSTATENADANDAKGLPVRASVTFIHRSGSNLITTYGYGSDIYYSADNGVNYIFLNKGLPKGDWIRCTGIGKTTAYACTDHVLLTLDLDGEKKWNKCKGVNAPTAGMSIVASGDEVYVVYGLNVSYSSDKGMNWTVSKPDHTVAGYASLSVLCGKTLFVLGKDKGELFSSDDKGTTWTDVLPAIEKAFANPPAVAEKKPKKILSVPVDVAGSVIEEKKKYDVAYRDPKGKNFGSTQIFTYLKDKRESKAIRKFEERFPGVWKDGIDEALTIDDVVYFFRGSQCIAFDIKEGKIKDGPRKIGYFFPGVYEYGIDAAVRWDNEKIYFFKDKSYVAFDLASRRTYQGTPAPKRVRFNDNFESNAYLSSIEDIFGGISWDNETACFFYPDGYIIERKKSNFKGGGGVLKKLPLDTLDGAFYISDNEIVFFKNPREYNKFSGKFLFEERTLISYDEAAAEGDLKKTGMKCRACNGSGKGKVWVDCPACQGHASSLDYTKNQLTKDYLGNTVAKYGAVGTITRCSTCNGSGGGYNNCTVCNGYGIYTGEPSYFDTQQYRDDVRNSIAASKKILGEILANAEKDFTSIKGPAEDSLNGIMYYLVHDTIIKPTASTIQELSNKNQTRSAYVLYFGAQYGTLGFPGNYLEDALMGFINDGVKSGKYKVKDYLNTEYLKGHSAWAYEGYVSVIQVKDANGRPIIDMLRNKGWGLKLIVYSKSWGMD